MTSWRTRLALAGVLAVIFAPPASAQNPTTAGELSVEPPTLLSAGFDWVITGDDNRNARVELTYRKNGESAWKQALPLLRLQHEWVNGGPPQADDNPTLPRYPFDYVVPNMFSGSLLNLEPDTQYEARLVLTDPDGVRGDATRTVSVRTRREPMPATGGQTYHVYPVDWKGPKQSPAFTGLMSAYYMGTSHYDYENAWPARVKPGDVILVHAGLYVSDRFHYMNGAARPGYLSLGTEEHQRGLPRRHQEHRRVQRLHAEALTYLQRRARGAGGLVGVEELLHRRQRVHRPPRSGAHDGLDRHHLGKVSRLSGAADVGVRHQGLRPGARRRPQLSGALARRDRRGDLRQSRRRTGSDRRSAARGALDPVFAVGTYTSYSGSDYNAFRPNPGKDDAFEWNTPAAGVTADYKTAPVAHRFPSLGAYSEATGQDRHSVLVDYDVFARVTMPDGTDPQRLYSPDGFDFRLRPGSAAIDAGTVLPSITDGFTGRAPDIGAYEVGKPVPHYGPR